MTKICIVSYYGFKECFLYAKQGLEKAGFEVVTFPLHRYMYDIHDKIDNYLDMFKLFIYNNNVDYLLWWFINIPTDEFISLKKDTGVKYLLFNWDEPFNWDFVDLGGKSPYFDAVFVTCEETLKKYTKLGVKFATCLYPGFHPDINYKITDINLQDFKKYGCDISICCTNLYDNGKYPDQYIPRKKIIDDIYNNQKIRNYKFSIYGPPQFKKMYPDSYKGVAKYEELNKIFNYSKINICTHVLCNKKGYLNERCILIGGSGGLLYVDNIKGIEEVFKPNEEVVIIDKDNYINQISSILYNYHKFIKIRRNLYEKVNKLYNYDCWGDKIWSICCKLEPNLEPNLELDKKSDQTD